MTVQKGITHQAVSKSYTNSKCVLCSGTHKLYFCEQFLNMPVVDHSKVVVNHMLCFNCLWLLGHQFNQCQFGGCKNVAGNIIPELMKTKHLVLKIKAAQFDQYRKRIAQSCTCKRALELASPFSTQVLPR